MTVPYILSSESWNCMYIFSHNRTTWARVWLCMPSVSLLAFSAVWYVNTSQSEKTRSGEGDLSRLRRPHYIWIRTHTLCTVYTQANGLTRPSRISPVHPELLINVYEVIKPINLAVMFRFFFIKGLNFRKTFGAAGRNGKVNTFYCQKKEKSELFLRNYIPAFRVLAKFINGNHCLGNTCSWFRN